MLHSIPWLILRLKLAFSRVALAAGIVVVVTLILVVSYSARKVSTVSLLLDTCETVPSGFSLLVFRLRLLYVCRIKGLICYPPRDLVWCGLGTIINLLTLSSRWTRLFMSAKICLCRCWKLRFYFQINVLVINACRLHFPFQAPIQCIVLSVYPPEKPPRKKVSNLCGVWWIQPILNVINILSASKRAAIFKTVFMQSWYFW